jgi:hypothetical protein
MTEGARKSNRTLISFAIGLLVGIAGTLAAPRMLGRYLPASLAGDTIMLAGVVGSKEREADRLLIRVPTAAGTVLARFTEDVADINLLVEEGDSIAFRVRQYEPFIENPTIARVAAARFAQSGNLPPPAAESTTTTADTTTHPDPDSAAQSDTLPAGRQ